MNVQNRSFAAMPRVNAAPPANNTPAAATTPRAPKLVTEAKAEGPAARTGLKVGAIAGGAAVAGALGLVNWFIVGVGGGPGLGLAIIGAYAAGGAVLGALAGGGGGLLIDGAAGLIKRLTGK